MGGPESALTMSYRCHYRGKDPAESWDSEDDQSLWAENIVCTRFAEENRPGQIPLGGLIPSFLGDVKKLWDDWTLRNPAAPTYPSVNEPTPEEKTEAKEAATAEGTAATRPPGRCCAPGAPKCLKCWLAENWIQLAILALALAAFLTRKK